MRQVQDLLAGRVSEPQQGQLSVLLEGTEVNVVSCLHWRLASYWQMRNKVNPDCFLFFPMDADLRAWVGDATAVLSPGQFMMMPEGVMCHSEPADTSKGLSVISIHCDYYSHWRIPIVTLFSSPFATLPNAKSWLSALRNLVCMFNERPSLGRAYGEVLLKAMFTDIVQSGENLAMPEQKSDPRMRQAVETIRRAYAKPLTVEGLANASQLSTVRFRKLFQEHTGSSPKAYILRHRIRVAARLLRSTLLSVKEIAAETGFANDHHFHLAFKKAWGCTPTEFRREGPI